MSTSSGESSHDTSNPWSIPNRHSTLGKFQEQAASADEDWLKSAPSLLPPIGERIAQRFRIIKRVGQGGMGIVYEAQDELRDERVALKFLNEGLLQDNEATQRFLNEARISIRLQHPNILRVYEVHETRGLHFFSMDLVKAESLRDSMNRWEETRQRPSPQEALQTLLPLLDALEYAHQHTVHRDIKPENICITKSGVPILMDFGIASVQQSLRTTPNRETVSVMRAGTPYYMAPEQIKNPELVDSRADQYSIAVVLYEMLTGELPIGYSRSLAELLPNGYEAFGLVIDRALAPDPADRFPDLRAFKEALVNHAEARFHWGQWRRKHPRLTTSLILASVILTAGAMWRTARSRAQERALEDKQIYNAAQAVAESNYQREQILKTSALEWRENRDWLERQFSLERRAWDSGLTDFQQWSHLVSISNQLNEARTIWRRLEPQLNPEGLPHKLAVLTSAGTQPRAIKTARAALSQALERSNRIERAHLALTQLTDELKRQQGATRISNQVSKVLGTKEIPQDWIPNNSMRSADELSEAASRGTHAVQAQLQNWNGLFGYQQAPDLSFLATPSNHLRRATFLIEQEDYASAITDLSTAYRTLKNWIDEVSSLRERTAAAWAQAREKEETDFGMRFIRVGGLYWSLHEVTVMDFARFMSESPHLSKQVGSYWQAPGYPQGPTHPAVGIDRDTATSFATWITAQFNKRFPLTAKLPTHKDWQTLLQQQSTPFKTGLYPNREEWDSNHFATHYLDPGVPPGSTTLPAASGHPSALGLFDSLGNLWEWCADDYQIPPTFQYYGKPSTWMLMGGPADLQVSYQEFSPPSKQFVWLVRKDRIGFRPTFVKH